jgi:hypothetical protein
MASLRWMLVELALTGAGIAGKNLQNPCHGIDICI